MRDCSDEYLAWDNAELATVRLKGVWDIDIQSYVEREFSDAVVRRTNNTEEFPNFNDLEISTEAEIFLVAAATIDGGPLTKGDTLKVENKIWIASSDVKVVRAGRSISHYKAIFYEQRG